MIEMTEEIPFNFGDILRDLKGQPLDKWKVIKEKDKFGSWSYPDTHKWEIEKEVYSTELDNLK